MITAKSLDDYRHFNSYCIMEQLANPQSWQHLFVIKLYLLSQLWRPDKCSQQDLQFCGWMCKLFKFGTNAVFVIHRVGDQFGGYLICRHIFIHYVVILVI